MSKGYTVIHLPHRCPEPTEDYPTGTRIRCDTCGREWSRSLFGWFPVRGLVEQDMEEQ